MAQFKYHTKLDARSGSSSTGILGRCQIRISRNAIVMIPLSNSRQQSKAQRIRAPNTKEASTGASVSELVFQPDYDAPVALPPHPSPNSPTFQIRRLVHARSRTRWRVTDLSLRRSSAKRVSPCAKSATALSITPVPTSSWQDIWRGVWTRRGIVAEMVVWVVIVIQVVSKWLLCHIAALHTCTSLHFFFVIHRILLIETLCI
jgi:hypothetical protein